MFVKYTLKVHGSTHLTAFFKFFYFLFSVVLLFIFFTKKKCFLLHKDLVILNIHHLSDFPYVGIQISTIIIIIIIRVWS